MTAPVPPIQKPKYLDIGDYKYQLTEDYTYQTRIKGFTICSSAFGIFLTPGGLLTGKTGFRWDGSSSVSIDTKTNFVAALVHDLLYRALQLGLIITNLRSKFRRLADREMRIISKRKKMFIGRRWWTWAGVRIGAGFAAADRLPVLGDYVEGFDKTNEG